MKEIMEKEEDKCWRTHVVFLPMPAQGHINPMLNFAQRLACKQVKVTIAIPSSNAKSIKTDDHSKITIEIYSDGSENNAGDDSRTLDSYLKCFKEVGTKNISNIIENYQNSKHPIKCLIYSSVIPYVQDIAKQYGLIGASFFTQSCAVNSIYYHVHHGHLITPVQAPVSLPGLPLLETHELPSVMSVADPDQEPERSVLRLVTDQFLNVEEVDWLLFNTFDKLEDEVMKWMVKLWPEKAISIGPTVPSIYLKNSTPKASNPDSTHSSPYIEWLNTKKAGSVVFVSFGTVAKVAEEQIEELTWGIKRSNMYFLWVVREEEQHKLPIKFKDDISEQGLLVSWCSQLEVLAHEAVGCFLTHCGWNSTIEALSMGVPMVAMPQYIDQPTDAKFVEEIWRVGVRAKVDDKGIVRREEIERCIKDIMQGQRREEIKRNAIRWKELAKEAVDEGGSSDKNIDKFIARLAQLS